MALSVIDKADNLDFLELMLSWIFVSLEFIRIDKECVYVYLCQALHEKIHLQNFTA